MNRFPGLIWRMEDVAQVRPGAGKTWRMGYDQISVKGSASAHQLGSTDASHWCPSVDHQAGAVPQSAHAATSSDIVGASTSSGGRDVQRDDRKPSLRVCRS